MADRIAVLHHGRVRQVGTPREIYDRPADRFVADFIGETNLLEGRVTGLTDTVTVETAVGTLRAGVGAAAAVGDTAWVSVRPECLRWAAAGDAADWNCVSGTVRRAVYMGNHTQYQIDAAGGAVLRMLEWGQQTGPASPGTAVSVAFRPEDTVLLTANLTGV